MNTIAILEEEYTKVEHKMQGSMNVLQLGSTVPIVTSQLASLAGNIIIDTPALSSGQFSTKLKCLCIDPSFNPAALRLVSAASNDVPRLELNYFQHVFDVLKEFGWTIAIPPMKCLDLSEYYVKNSLLKLSNGELVLFSYAKMDYFQETVDYVIGYEGVLNYVRVQLEGRGHDVAALIENAKAFNISSRNGSRKRLFRNECTKSFDNEALFIPSILEDYVMSDDNEENQKKTALKKRIFRGKRRKCHKTVIK